MAFHSGLSVSCIQYKSVGRILFVGALLVISFSSSAQPALDSKVLDGQLHAPEFPKGLSWLNTSAPIELQQLRGKFVLLDFWTFCCINCMHIIPDLKRLEQKYPQELVVIGVHSAKFQNEKDTNQIREAILRYEIQHPVVNDADFEVWQSYAARAWPTLVLINPAGRIVGRMSGEGVFDPIDSVLRQAIPYFEQKGALKRSPLSLTLESASRVESLLAYPGKISANQETQRLFITDSNHHRILITNDAGRILDVIGSGAQGKSDGSFEKAEFHHPQGTALDGEILYIADTENHLLRTANLRTREVSTILGTGEQARRMNVGGTGRQLALNSPWDVLVYSGKLYIAMAGPHQIWVADPKSLSAAPYAGSGVENLKDAKRLEAALAQTSGLTMIGNRIYFADSETSSVRVVAVGNEDSPVETIIGKGLFEFGDIDGDAGKARLQHPLGIAAADGMLYIADTYNSKIKMIDPGRRTSTTFAGSGQKTFRNGSLKEASFQEPGGLAWLNGKLYVADTNNHLIRVIDPKAKTVSTLELSGVEKLTTFSETSTFRGRHVDLGATILGVSGSELVVSFDLPDGYKRNDAAPFYLKWSATAHQDVQFAKRPEDFDWRKEQFPVRIPIQTLNRNTRITLDTVMYYCTSQESACLVDPIRASLEVRPAANGPTSVPVHIQVRKP